MSTYDREIRWPGNIISVSGCVTQRLADLHAVDLALGSGWRQPRWWEWWRWGEVRQPDDIVAMTDEERRWAIRAEERRQALLSRLLDGSEELEREASALFEAERQQE